MVRAEGRGDPRDGEGGNAGNPAPSTITATSRAVSSSSSSTVGSPSTASLTALAISAASRSPTRHDRPSGQNSQTDSDEEPTPDWPLANIQTPHEHDVLCGRGGGTNNHAGNERFRDLVNSKKMLYINSSKRNKPQVSKGIVDFIRSLTPPGRFLQKDDRSGLMYDIGDQKAREKTSQALREGAPTIRKLCTNASEDQTDSSTVGNHDEDSSPNKNSPSARRNSDPSSSGGTKKTLQPSLRPAALGFRQRGVSAPMKLNTSSADKSEVPSHMPPRYDYYGGHQTHIPSNTGPAWPHYQHAYPYHHYPAQTSQRVVSTASTAPSKGAAVQWVNGFTSKATPERNKPKSIGKAPENSRMSNDLERRLLLSEWISSGGGATSEAEADAYRTAGLLGIGHDEITLRLKDANEDIYAIVESHKEMIEKKVDASSSYGRGNGFSAVDLPAKKRRCLKLSDWQKADESEDTKSARKRIEEALKGMGAF